MTLKEICKGILDVDQSCRNSYQKLIWRVYEEMGIVDLNFGTINKDKFLDAPSTESIRRCTQQLFREDKLLGKNLIQPSRRIKENRNKLAREKGFKFINPKVQYFFNPLTQTYEY